MQAKQIRHPYRRVQNRFSPYLIIHFSSIFYYFSSLYMWLFLLILLAGDISENPGPSDSESMTESTTSNLESFDLSIFENHFSVVHYNIQSLLNKVDQLQVEFSHFDVVALSETWLSPNVSDDDIMFQNFQKPFRKDRMINNYGGVIVYVKENIACKRRHDLEIDRIECIWLEITLKAKSLLLGLFYRPPNSPACTLDDIETSIDLAFDSNIQNIIVTGDLNLNYLNESCRRKIHSLFRPYDLKQLIQEPTHFTESSSSLIDLVATNVESSVIYSGVGESVLDQTVRYHCPIFVVFNFSKYKQPCFKRKIWKYESGDYILLNQLIHDFDWSTVEHEDINVYAENFTKQVLNFCDRTIPNKTVTIRPSDPPWVTNVLRNSIRKRKRAHKVAKRINTPESWRKFRKLRNNSINILRKSKQDYKDKLAEKIDSNSLSSKDWWKTFKSLINKSKLNTIPPINYNGRVINLPCDKANLFNNFFESQTQLDDDGREVPHLDLPLHTLNTIHLTVEEVRGILKTLIIGKACGPDCINNRILKATAESISEPVTNLFNMSLRISIVPDIWKGANVSPIHKKDDKSSVENYRPISLISSVGKTFEKAVYKHVHNHLLENQVITPFQSGFTRGDSTVNQLVDIYNTFCQALDEGKEVRAVFCDISKAFDRVWHRGLIAKLKHYGICGPLLEWFKSYLSNRCQRVVIPGGNSDWTEIKAGVPQGSILGPLLFIVYINDIVNEIQSNIRLFADDTTLYIIVDLPDSAAQILNDDLERISLWSELWLVNFNPNKTDSLLCTRKRNRVNHPTLYLSGVAIKEVTTHKHLGLNLSNSCDWLAHVEYIKEKASVRLNLLRSLKFTLKRRSLQKIYFTFLRPILEYADVVWDNCTQYQKNELEKIQLEAGRIVTGTTKLVSTQKLYEELGWDKLSDRRRMHKLQMFYKMDHQIAPDYLCNLLPLHIGDVSSYPLRNADNYSLVHSRTALYGSSFLPSTIREWNRLPNEHRNAESQNAFKQNLSENSVKVPYYFFCGNREEQIIHTRLRTECSSLNYYLYRRNLVDSPNCICGSIENNKHYLLECTRYRNARDEMLNTIMRHSHITVDILLHGNANLPARVNEENFRAVQTYIRKTKRFKR
ncbi:MAG: hypothetical protein JAY96_05605 [Candidatus Thiodiazotropha endolucinida]|nr:hypothetical protein [Candidatus Thiodiazotropha taylori]MCW4247655.1 reverse transcriptase domain-containing protein [Candidatus Thiodiazotropha endolucinida]